MPSPRAPLAVASITVHVLLLILRRTGRQVLVEHHPGIEVFQNPGVTSGRIVGGVNSLGVLFPPINPQPNWQPNLVICLLGSEQVEILVLSDQFLESADVDDLRRGKLLLKVHRSQ
jgi:hypothetical protein